MRRVLGAVVLLNLIAAGACESGGGSEPSPEPDALSEPTGDAPGDGTDEGDAGADPEPDAPVDCPPPNGLRPSRRSEHAGVFDPAGNLLVVHGGSTAIPVDCGIPTPTFEAETWIYDVACDRWHTAADLGPGGRDRHAAAYDSNERRMIVFGGRHRVEKTGPYTLFDDTWAYEIATETWEEIATSSGPPARVNPSMAYDPEGHQIVLFGGNSSTSGAAYVPLDDVWLLDLEAGEWHEVTAPGGPSPRLFGAAAWDEKRKRLVVYGGSDSSAFTVADYFEDLWALDLSGETPVWELLDPGTPGTAPDGRYWSGLVRDAAGDRYLAFGGHDDGQLGNRNDLWAFDPEAGAWIPIREGDTFSKPAEGICDFPPDFTNVDDESPERRNAYVFAGGPDGAFVMGGKTDCGAIDDVYHLDFETDTWTQVVVASFGESCLRKGGLNCVGLCN